MAAPKPAFRSVKGRAQTPAPRKTLLSPFTTASPSASSQLSPASAKSRVPSRAPQHRSRIEQLFPTEIPPGHAVTVETSVGAVETVAPEDAEDFASRAIQGMLDNGYDEGTAMAVLLQQLTETRDLWVQRQLERREAAQNRQVIPPPLGSEFPFLMPLEETGDEAPGIPSADSGGLALEDGEAVEDLPAAALPSPPRARRRVASPRQPPEKRARTGDVRAPAAAPGILVKPQSPVRRPPAQPKAAPVRPNLTKSEQWQACSRMRHQGGNVDAEEMQKRRDADAQKLGLRYRPVSYCDYGKEYKPSRRPFPGHPQLNKTAAKIATTFRSDKAIIPLMPFVREVRECSRIVESDRLKESERRKAPQEAKWSKKALVMLKYAIEDSLLRKCGNAWKIAVQNNRTTCSLHDFHVAKDIMELPLDQRAEINAKTRA